MGTGLTATFASATEVRIGLRASESVQVTSGLPDGVAMTKFTQPLIDTPETIAVVPKFVLDDEGVTTLRDAVRNVPGVSLAAGEAGAQGDNLTIRGFTARNDIFLDGIRDFGSYYRDDFNYEQIEVLEGPAGVAFGRGSTGGVVNQESKVPQATPHVSVQTQFGTNEERRLTADVNEPLPQLAGGGAFRVGGDGERQRRGGQAVCGAAAVWGGAVAYAGAELADAVYAELLSPDGERYAGLWAAVVLFAAGAGSEPERLFWVCG